MSTGRHYAGKYSWGGLSCDRFGLSCDRFGLSCDRFGLSYDRSGLSCDRFGLSCDRSGSSCVSFGSSPSALYLLGSSCRLGERHLADDLVDAEVVRLARLCKQSKQNTQVNSRRGRRRRRRSRRRHTDRGRPCSTKLTESGVTISGLKHFFSGYNSGLNCDTFVFKL